jgi:PAS domain S-box-containing protein
MEAGSRYSAAKDRRADAEHIIVVDPELRILHLSRSLIALGGDEVEGLVGLPLSRLFEEGGCEALQRWLSAGDASATEPGLRPRKLSWLRPARSLRWNVSRLDRDGAAAFAVLSSSSIDQSPKGGTVAEAFFSQLSGLVETAKLAVFVIDRDGRFVIFNTGAELLSGFSRDEVLGKKGIADLFPLAAETELLQQLLDGGEAIEDSAMSLRCGDGGYRPVSLSASHLFDSLGEVVGSVSVALDRSGEQSMAVELEMLYHQMEGFSSITTQIISIENTKELFQQFAHAITEISDFSRTLISIFTDETPYREIIAYSGVEEEDIKHLRQVEFPRQRIEALLHGEFQISPNCFYIPGSRRRAVLDDQEVAHGTMGTDAVNGWHPDDNLLVTLKSGEELLGFFSVDDSKSGRRPTPETVKPLELFAMQITEVLARNRLEEELRKRHRDLQLLYEIMVIVNSSLDAGEVLQKLVESIKERMGYSLVSVHLIEDSSLVLKAIHGARPTEKVSVIEIGNGVIGAAALQNKVMIVNDTERDQRYIKGAIDASTELAVPIKSSAVIDGEETESIIGVLNIENVFPTPFTEEDGQRLEAIAATASIAIENSRLMDRVLSLLKEEANYSQELEQKKSELDEFVYTISHDLKSPLSSIKGYAEMLELEMAGKIDDNAARFISRIKANSEAVSRMINDLLELSRVGKVIEESRPIALDPLLYEISLDLKASSEGVEIDIKYTDLPERVTADRRRLAQLLTNLLSNAFKYRHPDRKPEITVGCSERQNEYLFYVEDNGIGIDPRHFQSIFVFGVRVREVKVEGTGAGLAIAKKIVETMGGRIWVESTKGEGSTFYFTLPR